MWANWGHCILNIWQKFNPFLQPLPCPLVRNSMTNTSKFTVSKLRFNNSQSFTSYSTLSWWSSWKAFGWREQSSRRICMLHFINSPGQRKSRLQVVLLLLSPSCEMRKKTVTEKKKWPRDLLGSRRTLLFPHGLFCCLARRTKRKRDYP